MVARVNKLCHGNKMKVSISAILRQNLKFGIQIPLDLRKESFWLLGGFGYHGNTKVSSSQPLLKMNVQTVFVDHS